MTNNKDHDNTLFDYLNYEFSPIPYENYRQEEPPFGNFNPGNFNPGGSFPFGPSPNIPSKGFNPTPMPQSPPPNYVPSKKDKGVQNLKGGESKDNISTKAVSPTSISFCLYKYTYIWETSGRSYWTFLLYIDRTTVSGFRWLGRNWVYFGLDLRRIDSFICYRVEDNRNSRNEDDNLKITCNEYTLNGNRNYYTQVLTSINIPEIKEDYIVETIGYIDEDSITAKIPCLKYRNSNYKLVLQVSYPDAFDESLKRKINEIAKESSIEAFDFLDKYRVNNDYANPLEIFNRLVTLIPKILNNFNYSFNSNLKKMSLYRDNINFCIKEEVCHENWQTK